MLFVSQHWVPFNLTFFWFGLSFLKTFTFLCVQKKKSPKKNVVRFLPTLCVAPRRRSSRRAGGSVCAWPPYLSESRQPDDLFPMSHRRHWRDMRHYQITCATLNWNIIFTRVPNCFNCWMIYLLYLINTLSTVNSRKATSQSFITPNLLWRKG